MLVDLDSRVVCFCCETLIFNEYQTLFYLARNLIGKFTPYVIYKSKLEITSDAHHPYREKYKTTFHACLCPNHKKKLVLVSADGIGLILVRKKTKFKLFLI